MAEQPLNQSINQSMLSIATFFFLRETDKSKQLCTRGVPQGQEREDHEFSMLSISTLCSLLNKETDETKLLPTTQGAQATGA